MIVPTATTWQLASNLAQIDVNRSMTDTPSGAEASIEVIKKVACRMASSIFHPRTQMSAQRLSKMLLADQRPYAGSFGKSVGAICAANSLKTRTGRGM